MKPCSCYAYEKNYGDRTTTHATIWIGKLEPELRFEVVGKDYEPTFTFGYNHVHFRDLEHIRILQKQLTDYVENHLPPESEEEKAHVNLG